MFHNKKQQFAKITFLFQHVSALVHKATSINKRFNESDVEEDDQPRDLTSAPSNTFEMGWKTGCKPGLTAQHQSA